MRFVELSIDLWRIYQYIYNIRGEDKYRNLTKDNIENAKWRHTRRLDLHTERTDEYMSYISDIF